MKRAILIYESLEIITTTGENKSTHYTTRKPVANARAMKDARKRCKEEGFTKCGKVDTWKKTASENKEYGTNSHRTIILVRSFRSLPFFYEKEIMPEKQSKEYTTEELNAEIVKFEERKKRD